MSIPPLKGSSATSSSSSKAVVSVEKSEPLHFSRFVEKHIEFNRSERERKIGMLARGTQNIVIAFLKKHQLIENLVLDINKIALQRVNEKTNKTLAIEYENKTQELERILKEFKKDFKDYGFEPTFIDTASLSLNENSLDIQVYMEISKNCFINKVSFNEEVRQFINEHKNHILHSFGSKWINEINAEFIEFQIKKIYKTQETHNHGKEPLFVTFTYKQDELFTIVYKPRNAAIDKLVIDTFDMINQLPADDKSNDTLLPVYKIENFENRSLWEFIEGINIDKSNSAGIFIRSNLDKGAALQRAEKNLNRMDAILTLMGISDLHKENVRVKNFNKKDKDIELVPIDLENLQKGQPSQLGGHPEKVNLTLKERQVIIDFFEPQTKNIICRHLPLSTNIMAGLIGDYKQNEKLSSILLKQFLNDKLTIQMQPVELQRLLFTSVLNQDVPYFTELSNVIYYGMPSEGHIIARKEA